MIIGNLWRRAMRTTSNFIHKNNTRQTKDQVQRTVHTFPDIPAVKHHHHQLSLFLIILSYLTIAIEVQSRAILITNTAIHPFKFN